MTFNSIEDVKNNLDEYNIELRKFIEDAIKSNVCEFGESLKNPTLIIKSPEFEDLNPNAIGLYLAIRNNEVHSYVAISDHYGIRDWLNLGDYNVNEGFDNVITKSNNAAGTCNYCHKYVGYKDIHQVSFAGKSCSNCLEAAKKKDEYSGWYN